MPAFLPGLDLSERFYREVVRPLLDAHFADIPHGAALIGSGSEVLGFDTEMSSDHDWGPRVQLFLRPEDGTRHGEALGDMLRRHLPPRFLGYPTDFGETPSDDGATPVEHHRVEVLTPRGYLLGFLNFDIEGPIEPMDWLTFPEQKLRALAGGRVFHDGIGLQAVRDRFSVYPRDVWLYLMAAGWNRIGQEEHLMGRAGTVNDEIGAGLLASRLARDAMRLCFLMEREYAPYPKWFGTAFARLRCGPALLPMLRAVQAAEGPRAREARLMAVFERLATLHNDLRVTEPLPTSAFPFFGRPYRVIGGGRFADALRAGISDPAVRAIASRPLLGGIDQISDNTDLLEGARWRPVLRRLYE